MHVDTVVLCDNEDFPLLAAAWLIALVANVISSLVDRYLSGSIESQIVAARYALHLIRNLSFANGSGQFQVGLRQLDLLLVVDVVSTTSNSCLLYTSDAADDLLTV